MHFIALKMVGKIVIAQNWDLCKSIGTYNLLRRILISDDDDDDEYEIYNNARKLINNNFFKYF